MSDLVERVARAICIDAGPDPDSSRVYPMSGPTWLDYEPEAKAAIAEMFGQECPWKEVILDELADYLLLKDEHESDPKLALRDLIDWEIKEALEARSPPAVGSQSEIKGDYIKGWNAAIDCVVTEINRNDSGVLGKIDTMILEDAKRYVVGRDTGISASLNASLDYTAIAVVLEIGKAAEKLKTKEPVDKAAEIERLQGELDDARKAIRLIKSSAEQSSQWPPRRRDASLDGILKVASDIEAKWTKP